MKILTILLIGLSLIFTSCDLRFSAQTETDSTKIRPRDIPQKPQPVIPAFFTIESNQDIGSWTDLIIVKHNETKQRYIIVRYGGKGIAIQPLIEKIEK